MERRDSLRSRRYGRLLGELRSWRNAREVRVEDWLFRADGGGETKLSLGDRWPAVGSLAEVSSEFEVPREWAGNPVELELWLGGEGLVRLSTGASGGLNPFHRTFRISDSATGGEKIVVWAELVPKTLFGTHVREPRLEHATLAVPEREVRALERELGLIVEACEELGGRDDLLPHLLDLVEGAFETLAPSWPSGSELTLARLLKGYQNPFGDALSDLPRELAERVPGADSQRSLWSFPEPSRPVEPLPEAAREAVERARRELRKGLAELREEHPPAGRVALTGHAHLDLAWLWPVEETRRKARRTFASVLGLMDRYDDFVFNQSSAQLYAWLEEDEPETFKKIKERVFEGRWEPIGGSWTEPDCQITGGESFVRQLLHGQRYFESRFGRRSTVAWLPDVFGFSPAIPQLLRGAGIRSLFTAKLSWNETNDFPHDLFEWEGIDGSRITAHTFENPGMDYNGDLSPKDLIGTWRNFSGKRRHPETLFSFGWGDGGGGPTERMLEGYELLKEFPAHPRLRMTRVEDYFADLPESGLPKWTGELYLELHRGTLTSQAQIKALNRAAEHRLREAEAFCEVSALGGFPAPRLRLDRAWKTLLLNQFHDILPGSSISEVNAEARAGLTEVCEIATKARDEALRHVADRVGRPAGAKSEARLSLVANADTSPRPLSVVLPKPEDDEETTVTTRSGCPVYSQSVETGLLVHDPDREVPSLGWTALLLHPGRADAKGPESRVSVKEVEGTKVIQNGVLRVVLGADGSLESVYDVPVGREVLAGRGNRLRAYVDKPREWDAWDVDADYESTGMELPAATGVRVVEDGPLRASVRVERRWRDSRVTQTYRLLSGSRRLDIETFVEWNERQVLLRALFPLAVRSHEATFETMYGVVRRPTHRNTSWDEARFEVSGHRFADISEPGYGVALLNDGKYGHSAKDNVLGLSLLRSPVYPDPLADRGEHRFTYSLFPHEGDWTQADLHREALAINSPLFAAEASSQTVKSEEPANGLENEPENELEASFLAVEGVPLALGSLKRAEDGDGAIVRLYEPRGARGESILRFGPETLSVRRTNLLEEPDGTRPEPSLLEDGGVRLDVSPFEVITLRVYLRDPE